MERQYTTWCTQSCNPSDTSDWAHTPLCDRRFEAFELLRDAKDELSWHLDTCERVMHWFCREYRDAKTKVEFAQADYDHQMAKGTKPPTSPWVQRNLNKEQHAHTINSWD